MTRLEHFHRRLVLSGPQNLFEWLLVLPLVGLSQLFGLVIMLRAGLYRLHLLKTYVSRLPVVSVGNLAAGGTGKTPFVDFLVNWFSARGLRVAVISRGYGGSFKGSLGVVSSGSGPQMSADVCGDEPYLLASRHRQAKVYIAPRRRDALQKLETSADVDVVVLDDAFQHRQVARDLDIVLLDARQPYGNGHLLPAGMLRERPSALKRADLAVLTRAKQPVGGVLDASLPVCYCAHRLADQVVTLADQTVPMAELQGKNGFAFAGIAVPESFFEGLRDAGLNISRTLSLPDHCCYDQALVAHLEEQADNADFLITTEKDAVKLTGFAWKRPCFAARLKLEFFNDDPLIEMLQGIVNRTTHEKHQR